MIRNQLSFNILTTESNRSSVVELVDTVLDDLLDSGKVPEMLPEHREAYRSTLMTEVRGLLILVVSGSSGYAVAAFSLRELDHHTVGVGCVSHIMVGTCPICTKALVRELRTFAKTRGMSWLRLQHRIGRHTYKSTLYKLR